MSFKESEKLRQAGLKPRLFSTKAQPDGTYTNDNQYPFCLADGCSAENLHESIRTDVLAYFRDRKIKWHDGCEGQCGNAQERLPSNHLCSSQCACVNTLAPMMRDNDLLARVMRIFLPDLSEPLPMVADAPLPDGVHPYLAFEWIDPPNALGEIGTRQRGAQATSPDFAFRFRRFDGRVQLVLGEWKYAEQYGGKLPAPCELNQTRLRIYEAAFNRWRESEPDLPPYEAFFVEPFYQLMRLTLLAQELEKAKPEELKADIVSVLHVSPSANADFAARFTSPAFRAFGRTVTTAWANIAPPGRFKYVSCESLLSAIELAASTKHGEWCQWLLTRYGWWRGGSVD